MAANVWLSVIAVVYSRTIRCQQWNGFFFNMNIFKIFFRPTNPNFSFKKSKQQFFK